MKKKLLTLLKTKYKKNGFSDKAFSGVVDYLEKSLADDATDEDIETAVAGVEPVLQAFQSELDARTAKYRKDSEEYQALKAKMSGKDPNEKHEDPSSSEPSKSDENMPGWAKALIKQNEQLAQQLQNISKGKIADTRKQTLEAKLKDLDPKLKAKALKDFDRMTFEKDEDFDAYVEETLADLGDFAQQSTERQLGAAGAPMLGTSTKKADAKEVDAQIEAWAKANAPKADTKEASAK